MVIFPIHLNLIRVYRGIYMDIYNLIYNSQIYKCDELQLTTY